MNEGHSLGYIEVSVTVLIFLVTWAIRIVSLIRSDQIAQGVRLVRLEEWRTQHEKHDDQRFTDQAGQFHTVHARMDNIMLERYDRIAKGNVG